MSKGARDEDRKSMNFFFAGDVMLGRGVDQVMEFKCDSKLYESFVKGFYSLEIFKL